MLLMSIKCFDLQDPNPIGVLKGVYHGGIQSCDNWGWVAESTVGMCSTLSLRAVNKELIPLIILRPIHHPVLPIKILVVDNNLTRIWSLPFRIDLSIDHYLLHWIYENYGYVVGYLNTYLEVYSYFW